MNAQPTSRRQAAALAAALAATVVTAAAALGGLARWQGPAQPPAPQPAVAAQVVQAPAASPTWTEDD